MATTNVVDGGAIWLKVGGTVVAKSTSHTLSMSMSPRDITNKDSAGWGEILDGVKTWECSADALYALDSNLAFDDLFSSFNADTAVTILAMRTDVSGDKYYTGSGYITSLEINAGNEGENVTYSVTIQGTSTLTEATIT